MGGHGVTGSADPLQVGVIPRYPGERADPLEREEASATDVLTMADDVTKLPTSSSEQTSPRQPPTASDTTAAAFPRSTYIAAAAAAAATAAAVVNILKTPHEANLGLENFEFAYFS